MSMYELVVDKNISGSRLDLMMVSVFEDASRSYIQKLIDKGNVKVNGKDSKKNYLVIEEDKITIDFPEIKNTEELMPENIDLNIIYEDQSIIVIDKPKGLVVHPGVGNNDGTLVNGLLHHCDSLSNLGDPLRPGIVHRLDKDTSGLLVAAKDDISYISLSNQFKERNVNRIYHVVVYNNFIEDEGIIEGNIVRDPKNRLKMTVSKNNGKEAKTAYKVIERFGKYTYVEAKLFTGRTHQIRVHFASINHPVLGDNLYGNNKKFNVIESQILHSAKLGFKHPKTDEYLEFVSQLPDYFRKILLKLRNIK